MKRYTELPIMLPRSFEKCRVRSVVRQVLLTGSVSLVVSLQGPHDAFSAGFPASINLADLDGSNGFFNQRG